MSELRQNGVIYTNTDENKYLVNNFTKTKVTTGWSLGGTLDSNGVAVLTGTSPIIQSSSFSVGTDDIVYFEFDLSLPTPSTTTGGPGLYLGSKYGDSTERYYYDSSTKKYVCASSGDTNPYFIYSYNSTDLIHVKTYILGANVDINKVPPTYCNKSIPVYVLLLPSTVSSTIIRSGYNSNTSMVIHYSNPKIYSINQMGISLVNDAKVSIGLGYISSNDFIEY